MQPVRRIAAFLLTAGLVTLQARAADDIRLPQLGYAGGGAITPQQEYAIGSDITRQLQRAGMLVEDPLLDEYIDGLGYRLVPASGKTGQPFEFFIVRDDSINAFALPGGFIGINAGLILTTDTESELAGVMAHEVAHVTQKHIARRFEAADEMGLTSAAAILGAILVGMSGAGDDATQAAMAGAMAMSQQQQINFTRANEYEADRVGIGILANAGFDPRGMVSFFEELQRRYGLAMQNVPEYLSTHPLSLSRITEARQRLAEYSGMPVHETRLYGLMRARLRVFAADNPQNALQYFGDTDSPDQPALEQLYGRAVALQRLNRPAEAESLFRSLLKRDESLIPFHLGLAESLAAQDKLDAASRQYRLSLDLFPGNRPLELAYARMLLDHEKYSEASRFLQGLTDRYSRLDALPVYRMLAEAELRLDRPADSHYYMAEYYRLNGNLKESVAQLQLASGQLEPGSLRHARIEARLEEARKRLEEAEKNRR